MTSRSSACRPGTRNHFALDLGLDRRDPRKSVAAFRDAVERRVDYATVNDRFFVNNVSLGVYATIVQEEGYREAKVDTTTRLLPEMLGDPVEPFDLQFVTPDGEEVDGAFLIMVSNNPYVLGASLDVSQRRRLDTGRLGVFAVRASTGAQAAKVVSMAFAGKAPAGVAFQFQCAQFEVRSVEGRPSRASTARQSSSRRPSSSAPTRRDCACSSPRATGGAPSSVRRVTFAPATWSRWPGALRPAPTSRDPDGALP